MLGQRLAGGSGSQRTVRTDVRVGLPALGGCRERRGRVCSRCEWFRRQRKPLRPAHQIGTAPDLGRDAHRVVRLTPYGRIASATDLPLAQSLARCLPTSWQPAQIPGT